MREHWRRTVSSGAVVALALALQGCCAPPKSAVRDAAKHISDAAEAGKAAQAICKSPPAGQDPALFCAKVDEAFDDIKKTSDALNKSAE